MGYYVGVMVRFDLPFLSMSDNLLFPRGRTREEVDLQRWKILAPYGETYSCVKGFARILGL